jgi:4-amino-4-deoxy-L-arabinose transferase-like glycosyltransferase
VAAAASVRNRLLLGTALLFVFRFAISLVRTGPVLVADEMGYLGNARTIAGQLPAQMELAPFYRGGYSLLLAPIVGVVSDPEIAYRLALALNALLAALVFPLLYLLLERFAGVDRRVALWAAFAGAAFPAVTVLSQVAMSENALYPLVCAWLLCFAGFLAAGERRSSLLWACGLGASTGGLWAVHNRMLVAVAITVLAVLWLAARRRVDRGPVGIVLGLIALAILGTHLLDEHLIGESYGPAAESEASNRLDALSHGHGPLTALANLIGQSWYLLVATFGLAALAAADFFSRGRAALAPRQRPLGVLLLFTALLLLVSAAAFPERTRPDMLIYGRYTEVVAPALIAFGFAALPRWRSLLRPLPWLLGYAAFTALVVLIRVSVDDPEAANRWNISALPFVTVQLGPAVLLGAALVAAAGAVLLLRLGPSRPSAAFASMIALFLAVTAYGVWNPVRSSQRAVYPSGWSSPQAAVDREGIKTLGYDLGAYDTIGLYATQWYTPETSWTLFEGEPAAKTRFVIGSQDWPAEHPRRPATELWRDEGRDQVLWRLGPRERGG